MKKTTIAIAIFISLIGQAFAQTKIDTAFELYILIGQSNMAGRGPLTAEFQAQGNPRVFMLNRDKQWVPAKHPLHFDKPKAAGVGPGLAFGMDMAETNPNVKIGLIPCAVGGTPIEHWKPGAFDPATKTHPYDDALIRIKEAMKSGVIKGVIWHQGEANSAENKSAIYIKQLKTLVKTLRREVGNSKLPFVVGELGRFRTQFTKFNIQLAKVPTKIRFTALAISEGLDHKGDSTHFSSSSATELGHRFAKTMIELQRKEK